jgi:hypothetical protein
MEAFGPRAVAPLTVSDLSPAEQLVLWAIRTRLEGRHQLANLRDGFDLAGR